MIMKTSFVCLLLIIYMGFFYFSNKHLPIRSTKVFYCYYVSATVLTFFDLITLYTVNHMDTVPAVINTIAHVIYLLSINATVYLNFCYLRSLLKNQQDRALWKNRLQAATFVVTSALIVVLPLGYVQGTYTNYSMGAKVYALYASIIIYNLLILYYCIRYWKLLNKEKRVAIVASVPIFFCVSVINLTMPEALFSIVYVILTAVGLMLSNENNEKYLDKQTGMFNQYALGIVSSEYINLGKNDVGIVFTLSESECMEDMRNWRNYIVTMEYIQHFCRKELKKQAYRVGENGFVLLLHTEQSAERVAALIKDYAGKCGRNDIELDYKIFHLNECESSDVFIAKILDACIGAINKMAIYDFLTGVYNRNMFEKELDQAKKDGADVYYLIADLNNLKETNDVLGHSAGDELLQSVAKLLADTVGDMGMVFRQGGDEFAALWRGTNVEQLLEVLEKNRKRLNHGRVVPLSYAVGYGRILEADGIEKADRMMYENKVRMKKNKAFRSSPTLHI